MHSFVNTLFSSSLFNSSQPPQSSNNMHQQRDVQGREASVTNSQTWGCPAYCHHDRTGSVESTEYWVWKGPNTKEELECNTSNAEVTTTFSLSDQGPESELEQDLDASLSLIVDKVATAEPSFRLEDEIYSPCLNLCDTATAETGDFDYDSSSASYFESSFASDLPSESFSLLLSSNRLALDADTSQRAASFELLTNSTGERVNHLFGLGIYGISRKDDPLCSFDGLGAIHARPSPWRTNLGPCMDTSDDEGVVHVHVPLPVDGHDEDEEEVLRGDSHLSETFLHDLEAFFLAKDSGSARVGQDLKMMVEGPGKSQMGMDPIHFPQTFTPKNLGKRIKDVLKLTLRRPSHTPSSVCATVSSPNLRFLTHPTRAVSRSVTSNSGSTFIRRTRSASSSKSHYLDRRDFYSSTKSMGSPFLSRST